MGLKEQQIQRYEARWYESASFARLKEVALALDLEMRIEVTFKRRTEANAPPPRDLTQEPSDQIETPRAMLIRWPSPAMPTTYLTHLECADCGTDHDATVEQHRCRACGGILLARYDLAALGRDAAARRSGRAARRGCGATPSCCRWPTRRGGSRWARAARRCCRCRGLAAELDIDALAQGRGAEPDRHLQGAGRGGGRGARRRTGRADAGPADGGQRGHGLERLWRGGGAAGGRRHAPGRPRAHPAGGAALRRAAAPGGRADQRRGRLGGRGGRRREGWYDASTFKEPYRLEGKKTLGLEIAEQLGWTAPDVILYPTGGGVGLIGLWKAFRELRDAGLAALPTRPCPGWSSCRRRGARRSCAPGRRARPRPSSGKGRRPWRRGCACPARWPGG